MIPAYLLPLANHLWQSTLFAAVAGMLTLAFRKNRAPVRYGLWLAASLKFLLPFSLLVGIGSQLDWRTAPSLAPAPLSFVAHQIAQPFESPIPEPVLAPVPQKSSLVPALLLGVWLCGFMTSMVPWFNRWRRIRVALRSASPIPLDLPIPVMCSSMRLEPGVFGIRRPVLLLPEGLTDHLTPAQLDAVLAHELCHVRRHDNLAAAVHMLVEALFWFHPLVWWIETRMTEERERACDEEVLRAARDPEVYAEGILNVCKLYLESPLACMSGVTGANLKKRIEAIMTQRVTLNLTFGKKLLLAVAGMAAVVTPILFGILNIPQARGQSPQAFDVVSVKPHSEGDTRMQFPSFLPGGRLTSHAPLFIVIATAYNVAFQGPRLTGGPDWIRSADGVYDIEATPPKDALPQGLASNVRAERLRSMLQALLIDRFKLVIRRETKEMPVYTLTVGKGGLKLKKAAIEEKDCPESDASGPNDGRVYCHQISGGRGRGLHGQAVDMADIVKHVENWTDRPLLDNTGVQGLFQIDTKGWLPIQVGPPPAAGAKAEDGTDMADVLTVFQMFEKLGLKMEPQKARVETFVIDHIERPTEN